MTHHLMTYQQYFFIGIGGIGMSAIARYFKLQGKAISGYDRTKTPLTQQLQAEGLNLIYDESEAEEAIANLSSSDIIIYSAAFKPVHPLLKQASKHQIKCLKRAAVLGELSHLMPTIAVAGTHGKTTTAAMLTHILNQNQVPLTAFIGGILADEDTNFIHKGDEVMVVEADEYDQSFLQLSPKIGCVISVDADHIDTYPTHAAMQTAFAKFSDKVNALYVSVDTNLAGTTVGINSSTADVNIKNINYNNNSYRFDLNIDGQTYKQINAPLPGYHNVLNTAFALALAYSYKADLMTGYIKSLNDFKGIKRRFNIIKNTEHEVIIDDYAHHPEAIKSIYNSLRDMFPESKIRVIFQPHLYSRTQQFEKEFATVLSMFDEVHLLPIYPAREEEIPGITSGNLLKQIHCGDKKLIQPDAFPESVFQNSVKVKAVLGAGDIGQMLENIKPQMS